MGDTSEIYVDMSQEEIMRIIEDAELRLLHGQDIDSIAFMWDVPGTVLYNWLQEYNSNLH